MESAVQSTLLLDVGIRMDRDKLVPRNSWSPRLGFGWSPWGSEKTRVSGGYTVIYDASSLRLFTRPLDQYTLTTYYHPDGSSRRRGRGLHRGAKGGGTCSRARLQDFQVFIS